MENTKIIKKIVVVLLCIAALVSISVNAYQFQQIKKLSQVGDKTSLDKKTRPDITLEEKPLETQTAKQFPDPSLLKSQLVNYETDDLKEQIAEAKEELTMVNKKLSDDAAKTAEEKKARLEQQNKIQKISKIYQEDPSFKKMRRNAYKSSLNSQYADLFKRLNLTAEKLDKFKDLLADEIAAQQEVWTQAGIDGSKTPSEEQQEELSKRSQALNKEYESKKSDLLGKDGYAEYQAYNETAGERYAVNRFIESNSSNEKLTGDQKEDLIEAMHEEVKDVRFEFVTSETPSSISQKESMARQLDFQARRDDAYTKAAKGILSASQYEQLETYLKKQRDQLKLMMESSMTLHAQTEDEEGDVKKPE
jgi:hypothetical protein